VKLRWREHPNERRNTLTPPLALDRRGAIKFQVFCIETIYKKVNFQVPSKPWQSKKNIFNIVHL
jgi:hypothetical protein